jgi:hypothetical protein
MMKLSPRLHAFTRSTALRHTVSVAGLLVFATLAMGSGKKSGSGSSGGASKTEPATEVPLATLLSAYEKNELSADNTYKGKRIKTSGTVDSIAKDFLDDPYMTVGTGKDFEIPQVHCHLTKEAAEKAAKLSKGATVTIQGEVKGLTMNVRLDECTID